MILNDIPADLNVYVNDDPFSGAYKHYEASYVC